MDIAAVEGNPSLSAHAEWLGAVSAAILASPSCAGAAVVGSLASGTADELSDIDLVVYVLAGTASSVMEELRGIAGSASAVIKVEGAHDGHSQYEKAVRSDLLSYEIHVIEPSTRFRLRAPYIEVVNRNACLESRTSQDKPIGREYQTVFANGEAGLAWELFNCIKQLRRGEVRAARRYLAELGRAVEGDAASEA
jgi:predicted nucleotidyltransferase